METSHEADFDPREGARNLLVNCLKLTAGDRLVMVTEEPGENFYDSDGPSCVAAEVQRLDCQFTEVSLPLVRNPAELPAEARSLIAEASHLVFFSRLGDQVRFTDLPGPGTKTMCYALDIGFLGSSFCRLPHGFMEDLSAVLWQDITAARRWRISCPRGSDLSGKILPEQTAATDFTVKLFPQPIFPPISCGTASGRLVFGHWLMSTGNSIYEAPNLLLDGFLVAKIEKGRIQGFDGAKDQVIKVQSHFERVGKELNIDPYVVHSWHSGVHPKAYYPSPAQANIERWGAVAFANPRYTHFHSCGDYAPGEIALSLFDASIAFDDQLYWDRGDFSFLKTSRIAALATKHGLALEDLRMNREIGLE
jgi:hypothetical protein